MFQTNFSDCKKLSFRYIFNNVKGMTGFLIQKEIGLEFTEDKISGYC